MKRSPIQRKTSLKRTPMRRNLRSTKYSRRERDTPYMTWVRGESCALSGGAPVACDLWRGAVSPDECRGQVEAHHAGRHGLGEKAPDQTCMPLCDHHHNMITGEPGGRGCFGEWPRGTVKTWELACAEYYMARFIAQYVTGDGEEQLW